MNSEDREIQQWHQDHLDCPHKDPEDGCCGHDDNLTPECFKETCPLAREKSKSNLGTLLEQERQEREKPKVYVMNEYDTVVANSPQEAIDYYMSLTGDPESIQHPVEEVDYDNAKLRLGDCGERDAPLVTFRKGLEDWIATGGRIPEVFTSTEY